MDQSANPAINLNLDVDMTGPNGKMSADGNEGKSFERSENVVDNPELRYENEKSNEISVENVNQSTSKNLNLQNIEDLAGLDERLVESEISTDDAILEKKSATDMPKMRWFNEEEMELYNVSIKMFLK